MIKSHWRCKKHKENCRSYVKGIVEDLNDGKLTPEEKLHIIQSAKDNLFGQWADLSQQVEEKKEEEKKAPAPEPEL